MVRSSMGRNDGSLRRKSAGSSTARHHSLQAEASTQPSRKRARRNSGCDSQRRYLVRVRRRPTVERARQQLPVTGYEQEIVEAIRDHHTVIITGATGSGKTTQVPQFLFEEGFGDARSSCTSGMVAVTQPRRIAAVTCARRVAEELGTSLGGEIGYHVRHDRKMSASTKIKFCTDGVLLREVESDLLLKRYSAVIIDEIHERTYDTDLLLAFLSRSVVLRESDSSTTSLKLILMSATLDQDSVRLFSNAPTISIPARQFPVTIHFSRQTEFDYVSAAFVKVTKIHQQLPKGDVLVFLTGKMEVEDLCRRLTEKFGSLRGERGMRIHPLYAALPESLQMQVFQSSAAADAARKVVVSTNVAETSITIPGIRYVVDSGRVKRKVFRSNGLITAYEVSFTSQASAAQRAGRAGRTGPGHCYRLFSSAVMEQMTAFHAPEITQKPADEIVLRLRALGIKKVADFPFPTRPKRDEIHKAEKLLTTLGALSGSEDQFLGVTKTGRYLSRFPLPPRFALLLYRCSSNPDIMRFVVRIAAILASGSPFSKSSASKRTKQSILFHPSCELLSQLRAVCAAEYSRHSAKGDSEAALRQICSEFHLHSKTVKEILKTSEQLEGIVTRFGRSQAYLDSEEIDSWELEQVMKPLPSPPTQQQEEAIKIAILSAFPDQIARRLTRLEAQAASVPPQSRNIAFSAATHSEPVFLDTRSGIILESSTRYVTYTSLLKVKEKVLMQNVSILSPTWIPTAAPSLCEISKTMEIHASARLRYSSEEDSMLFSVKATYIPMQWPLGEIEVAAKDVEHSADAVFWGFGAALLRGKVIRKFENFKDILVGAVDTLGIRRGGSRALDLIQTLKERKCCSRKRLLNIWKTEPTYLMVEVLQWIKANSRTFAARNWQEVVSEELSNNKEVR